MAVCFAGNSHKKGEQKRRDREIFDKNAVDYLHFKNKSVRMCLLKK